jgi:hypothetical protein
LIEAPKYRVAEPLLLDLRAARAAKNLHSNLRGSSLHILLPA